MNFGIGIKADQEIGYTKELLVDIERRGFSTIWFPDERFYMEAFSIMTLCAALTKKVRIGVAVTDPFIRHPALTATVSATVDAISDERMVLGIGAGAAGFEQLGISRTKPVTAIREAVELIRKFQTGERVSYSGQTVSLNGAKLDFLPKRQVPIFIAGRGAKVLQLAGEIGDGVMIGALASERGLAYAFENISAGVRKAKRRETDLERALWIHTCISEDGPSAKESVKGMVAYVIYSSAEVVGEFGVSKEVVDAVLKGVEERLGGVPSATGFRKFGDLISDDLVDMFSLAGSPEQIVERISFLKKRGIQHIAFNPYLQKGMEMKEFVRLLSDQVMSHFATDGKVKD